MIPETEETGRPITETGAASAPDLPSMPMILAIGGPEFEHPAASAVICEAAAGIEAPPPPRDNVIWHLCRGEAPPPEAQVCVTDGLVGATELAAEAPDLVVVPRVEARRVRSRYGFNPSASGSGFSTYHLDPASVQAFTVSERGQAAALGDWLRQAQTLGFAEVWLHGVEAEAAGRGFACDLLAKAHRIAPDLGLWISGGGREPVHFANAAQMPGLAALVVGSQVLSGLELGSLNAALRSAPPSGSGLACGAV
jgi:hypothetical protein